GRADARELQCRAQERAAQAGALEIVVAAALAVGAEPDGAVRLAIVDEFQGQDTPGAGITALVRAHLVDDAELVAAAQVAQEVDLGAEDIGHLHGDRIGNAGRVGGAEQRRADGAYGYARLAFGAVADFAGRVGCAGRRDQEHPGRDLPVVFFAGGVHIAQPYQLPFGIGGSLHRTAG